MIYCDKKDCPNLKTKRLFFKGIRGEQVYIDTCDDCEEFVIEWIRTHSQIFEKKKKENKSETIRN